MARCYAYEEVFAEKIRALADRARPRDLYDVINLYRQRDFQPSAAAVLDILAKKSAFKNMAVPTLALLAGAAVELLADWQAMLGHQLPALPPFDNFWAALPEFFGWLESGAAPPVLATAPVGVEEEVVQLPVGFLRRQGVAGSSFLELVRFAGANRLCVELDYGGSSRRIEPYSLRRTLAGNIVLYAVRADNGEPRSYRLDRIQGVRVTGEAFAPRYVVDSLQRTWESRRQREAVPDLRGVLSLSVSVGAREHQGRGVDPDTSSSVLCVARGLSERRGISMLGRTRARKGGIALVVWVSWLR